MHVIIDEMIGKGLCSYYLQICFLFSYFLKNTTKNEITSGWLMLGPILCGLLNFSINYDDRHLYKKNKFK